MRLASRFAIALVLSTAFSARASAQANSVVVVAPYSDGEPFCFQLHSPDWPGTSSAHCQSDDPVGPLFIVGGTGEGHSYANQGVAALSTSASLSQSGLDPIDAVVQSIAAVGYRGLYINGTTNPTDRLRLRFNLMATRDFLGGSEDTYGSITHDITVLGDYDEAYLTFFSCACGKNGSEEGNHEAGDGWDDFFLPLGDYADSWFYYSIALTNILELADADGASALSMFAANLVSVDAVDEFGNLRGTTYLYEDGDGEVNLFESAAPEPASLILLGTGLAGVVAVARRRRKSVLA